MKRFLPAILAAAVLTGCTASNESTEVTETSGTSITVTAVESTETTTENEAVAETSEVTEKTVEYSRDVQKMARTFAKLVYEELENNKVSEDPTVLVPISCNREIPETGFDSSVFEADIFFIDTNFDGVPELFAGGHGAMGTGRYSVFTADGGTYGNGSFAHHFCSFCIAEGSMYAASGSNSYWGWTKLCPGLPSIRFNGFLSETGTNDVSITLADGTEQTLTGLTFDEAKALYPEYFGVEYDELNSLGEDEDVPFIYARGLLEVPDPENYTEDDIYNCLAKLLAEYEKSAGTVSAAASAVTKKEPMTKADIGINEDGTLNGVFTERILTLAEQNKPDHGLVYPALWDFDGDGVPEIILTHHNSGQGLMPSYVYSAESMEQIGEFDGFCRDGFTRFINTDGGTVIYNYYEHSEHQRAETVEQVGIKDGKLVSESLKKRTWVIAWGDNYPHHMEFSEEYSDADERDYSGRTAEYYRGNVCTSYSNKTYGDIKNVSENAAESYNNYIKAQALAKEDTDRVILAGEKNRYTFLQNKEGFYFIDEKGEKTVIKEGWAYYNFYRLWDNMIVSDDPGNLAVCDIYVISDGKPKLITELSGKGMLFDYSHFYNGGFELTHSTYDGMCTDDGGGGMHTFKKYQFYPTKDGWREYGSIVVPMDEFMEIYSDDIKSIADELAKEDTEIYEVLYRSDCCFILNCRKTIFLDEEKTQPAGAYYTKNITLKPLYDGGFSELCRDTGVYRTALIPEIAVYPEKYYTKDKK